MKLAEGLGLWLRELAAKLQGPEFGSQHLPVQQATHSKNTCSLSLRGESQEDCQGLLALSLSEKL